MSLLILSNKRYHRDFRKYLMRAAERRGIAALHVYSWEQVVISRNGTEFKSYPSSVDPDVILREIEDALGGHADITLTGLGGNQNHIASYYQKAIPDSFYVYDIYDDLLFDTMGAERIERMLTDAQWRVRCDRQILLNENLRDKYPRADHLDNASHLTLLPRRPNNPPRMVYIGSIDTRLDHQWLINAAKTGLEIGIYGNIHGSSPEITGTLAALESDFVNVSYHGGFDNDDLWGILNNYDIGLLPYKENHHMTRYINPDKLYHYLNAGLEVVTSRIPPVERYGGYLNFVSRAQDWEGALNSCLNARKAPAWPRERYNWDERWIEFEQIVSKSIHFAEGDVR